MSGKTNFYRLRGVKVIGGLEKGKEESHFLEMLKLKTKSYEYPPGNVQENVSCYTSESR